MPEPNLTLEQLIELEALMPPPGACPHGASPAHTSRGMKNLCSVCMQAAKDKLAAAKK